MRRIDGIHRVFIVVASAWTLFALIFGYAISYPFDGIGHAVFVIFGMWVLPVGFMYSIVWAINGFRKKK